MTWKVLIDWNRDFQFSAAGLAPSVSLAPSVTLAPSGGVGSGDDVTARVLRQQGVSFEYGRDLSTALAPTVSGRGSFTLDNRSRDYTPRNSSSPLYGLILPARPVLVTRTVGATTYIVFTGHTDDNPLNPDVNAKTVSPTCVDYLADLRGQEVSTELYRSISTGQAIGYILDAVGWTGGRDLDYGATIIPWWWEEGTEALTAMEKIVRSEGPPALLTVGTDGTIIFRDRHHRLIDTRSVTSQSTWHNKVGPEPIMSPDFVADEAWSKIINTGSVPVEVRTPSNEAAVWTSEGSFYVPAFKTHRITVAPGDPFYDAVSPVVNTDYKLGGGSATVTITRTSGASTTITMVAGSSGAFFLNLQLRAKAVPVANTVQVSQSDTASIDDFGQRTLPTDLPWCGVEDAKAVLQTVLTQRAQPLPVVYAEFQVGGTNTARAAAVLPLDLSDRVHIVEPESNFDNDFFVESFRHTSTGQFDHRVQFGAELAPPEVVAAAELFILGSAVAGHRLDSGKLAA